jgi:hypothetical protein
MAQYRYLFADLTTNQIIGELPLTGVSFTQQLNTIGTFSGHLLLSGVNAYDMNVNNSTIPGRTAIYVDRDGTLIWGGIIWGRDYTSGNQTLTINAREFGSYFERRRITATIKYTNTDQLDIVRGLINTAQLATNGSIGLAVGTETSGQLVSRTYYGYELKTVFSAIQDLSRADNGFDFNVYVYYDSNGNPAKLLRLGYPRFGTPYTAGALNVPVLELTSNMVEYEYPEDGTIAANTVYALGAGSNEGKLIATAVDATKLSTGWPLLEEQANYSDITDATLLANLAAGQVAVVSYPPTTMKITLPPYLDPVLGTYDVGDDIRIRILDDRFPTPGLDTVLRLVAFNVMPGEDGPERVTLVLTNTNN